jgi:hypothetical protein
MTCSTDTHKGLLKEYLSAVSLVTQKKRSYRLYRIVCVFNHIQSINIIHYWAYFISQQVAVAQFGTVRDSKPEYFPERSHRLGDPQRRPFSGCQDSLPKSKLPGVKLTTDLYLVPKQRTSGAILLSPLYAFIARTVIIQESRTARSDTRTSGCLRPGTMA